MKEKVTPTQKALNLWAVILIVWSIYRAHFRMPAWFDEFIAKPLVFVLPVYYYIKKIEKKDFFEAISFKAKSLPANIFYGLLLGSVFILTAFLANAVKFKKIVFFIPAGFNLQSIIFTLSLSLATGISEEILSRGFVLKRLYEESRNIYTASFFASILFFFLHVPILFTNVKITGNLLLFFMAVDILLSLVNSFIFLERRDLVLPILIHAFYNLSVMAFV